jgi:hypothetical protein
MLSADFEALELGLDFLLRRSDTSDGIDRRPLTAQSSGNRTNERDENCQEEPANPERPRNLSPGKRNAKLRIRADFLHVARRRHIDGALENR